MKSLVLFLLSLCFFVTTCKNRIHEKSSFQKIDAVFSKEMTLMLSDFVDSIELIPLQTNEKSIIGTITRIIFHKDKIYAGSASMVTDKVLVFSRTGEYLYKLDKQGKGPDEYLEIKDFTVVNDSKILIIVHSDPRIMIFDPEHDQCLLNRRLDMFPYNIILNNNYIYLFNNGISSSNDHVLAEYTLNGEKIASYYEPNDIMRKKISFFLPIKTFNQNNNEIFFHYPFCDTIYKIESRKLYPAYYLDFGNKKIPNDIFNKNFKNAYDISAEIKKNRGLFWMPYCNITSGFIHFTIQDFENNGYIAFYNKSNNHTIIGHKIIDDKYFVGNDYELKVWQLPKNMDKNWLIWHIDPERLKAAYNTFKKQATEKEWNQFCVKYPKIVEVCKSVQNDDNPVLVRMKISLK